MGRGGGAADGEEKPFPLGEVAAQPTERDTERVIESPFHHPLTRLCRELSRRESLGLRDGVK